MRQKSEHHTKEDASEQGKGNQQHGKDALLHGSSRLAEQQSLQDGNSLASYGSSFAQDRSCSFWFSRNAEGVRDLDGSRTPSALRLNILFPRWAKHPHSYWLLIPTYCRFGRALRSSITASLVTSVSCT